MLTLNEVNEKYFDVLKEIGNIGAGNATTAIANMLGLRIDMSVPEVAFLPVEELGSAIGAEDEIIVGIMLGVEGDIDGSMMFLMDMQSAHHIVNKLMMRPDDYCEPFDEMDLSAIKEIGNIIAGSYLSALSGLTNLTIVPSVPFVAVDMAAAILSVPAVQFGIFGDNALMINTEFSDDLGIRGHFILMPEEDSYDISFELNLTRKQTKEVKELIKDRNHYRWIPSDMVFDYLPPKSRKSDPVRFYKLSFRIVRFPISEETNETIITNLPTDKYPAEEIKKLYASRWGIETSFRDLKYTMGMLDFHSKKVECIQQEIYAHLIMYNFAEMITSHVVIKKKQRKYTYKANFSVAAHMCRKYYRGTTSPPDLETIISRNLVPIRPDRHRVRYQSARIFRGFLYRVA